MTTRSFKWVPVIDEDLCNGCAACVEACGPKSLEIQDGVAVLARPGTCGSEEHCIAPCPTVAIRMAWVAMTGDQTCGKWQTDSRADTAGIQSRPADEKETQL